MLIPLAICFKALNLYSHHAHNLAAHVTFNQDHAFFAEIYDFADSKYDDLIERHIGTVNDQISLAEILSGAQAKIAQLAPVTKENKGYYLEILKMVDYILAELEKAKTAPMSIGTQNMLAGIADELEVIKYKIKRRVG